MEHTKGKWDTVRHGSEYKIESQDAIPITIARCGSGSRDGINARRIVQCVNGWDGLVEALESVCSRCRHLERVQQALKEKNNEG